MPGAAAAILFQQEGKVRNDLWTSMKEGLTVSHSRWLQYGWAPESVAVNCLPPHCLPLLIAIQLNAFLSDKCVHLNFYTQEPLFIEVQ